MRSTRQLICVTALALTVFTQLLISQIPSPSHQSSNSATAKASNGKANCTDNGTYQNSRARRFPDPRIVRHRPKELPRNVVMGATVSALADVAPAHIMAASPNGSEAADQYHK